MAAYLSGDVLNQVAATLTAALYQTMGHAAGSETPEDIAKLFFAVHKELEQTSPKGKGVVQKLGL